ncbi:MAG: 50S ribosomal protein L35 [Chitinivibrionia bacterium]|jgi:large subunit ribosomal protein L35|nr:50S ribosomal protein L35 [Chitinivibrionia bacterium]
MPKMKTRKAAKKRFGLTGTGKVRRSKAFKNHILTKKSPKRKRNLRGSALVHKSQEKKIKAMIAA